MSGSNPGLDIPLWGFIIRWLRDARSFIVVYGFARSFAVMTKGLVIGWTTPAEKVLEEWSEEEPKSFEQHVWETFMAEREAQREKSQRKDNNKHNGGELLVPKESIKGEGYNINRNTKRKTNGITSVITDGKQAAKPMERLTEDSERVTDDSERVTNDSKRVTDDSES